MQTPLFVQILSVIMLLAVVVSLGIALVQLVRDRGDSTRMVRALTLRITLSIALFILLMLGIFAGFITPHGVAP